MQTEIALIEATPAVAVEAAAPVAAAPAKRTRTRSVPKVEAAPVVEAKPKTAGKAKAKTPAKPKADAKPATATKAPAKVKNPPKAKKAPTLSFTIATGGKPSAGARLFAFTQAVHDLTGMSKGGKVGRATLRVIMGDTAIAYHLRKGNYALTADSMVYLTELGQATFALRAGKILPSEYASFVEILTTGKPNEVCKNEVFILAV